MNQPDDQDVRRRSSAVRLAIAAYCVNGAVALVFGAIYVASSRFLPYHEDAIGREWETLDADTQVLLRALVHLGGGGWLVAGATFVVVALIPLRRGEPWAAVFLPIAGLLFWIPNLWATLEVTLETEATAPWFGSAAGLVATVAAAALTGWDAWRPARREGRPATDRPT